MGWRSPLGWVGEVDGWIVGTVLSAVVEYWGWGGGWDSDHVLIVWSRLVWVGVVGLVLV